MQLVSCCIDRNGCSPVVPTVETWTVKATKVCQLSAFRPAEGSVLQGKPIFTAPMARCTTFLVTCAVAQHLDVLCILRHTLVSRSCAEYGLGPILSQRIQTVSHILFVDECNESAPYLEANSAEMLRKYPPFMVPERSLTCSQLHCISSWHQTFYLPHVN